MPADNRNVFVNCPFDDGYRDFFNAIVFTIFRSGFYARCALEADNAADNRFDKICRIIRDCRFAIHDISRTETSGNPPLPRFNMPLELGLFLGACKFGGQAHRDKTCLIFDRDRYRYQRFISDIAGQDIHSHNGDIGTLIADLSAWLRDQRGGRNVPGGQAIRSEFAAFTETLPLILAGRGLRSEEMTFGDYCSVVTQYLVLTG